MGGLTAERLRFVCGESEERKLRSRGHDDGTEGALVPWVCGSDSPPAARLYPVLRHDNLSFCRIGSGFVYKRRQHLF